MTAAAARVPADEDEVGSKGTATVRALIERLHQLPPLGQSYCRRGSTALTVYRSRLALLQNISSGSLSFQQLGAKCTQFLIGAKCVRQGLKNFLGRRLQVRSCPAIQNRQYVLRQFKRQSDALVRLRHAWSLPPAGAAFYPQLAAL